MKASCELAAKAVGYVFGYWIEESAATHEEI